MKREVFNQYVERVANQFDMDKADLFVKSKKKEIVDARHLLYYLCYKRQMKIIYIQKYMGECGYDIKHSSVIYGIASVEVKMKEDKDYVTVIRELEKAVFI